MDSPLQPSERRSISVVTPVYNGEGSVAELCRRLDEVLPRVAVQHEIILVNDGSRDHFCSMKRPAYVVRDDLACCECP